MIDKKFSASLLKAIVRRSRGLSDHNIIHPEREWFVGILIALICLIAGIIWSAHLYFTYAGNVPDLTASPATTNQIYRAGDVVQALEEYRARNEENNALRAILEAQPKAPSFVPITPDLPEPSLSESPTSDEMTATSTETLPPTDEPVDPTLPQAL
jgi:hypothetical protein